MSLKVHIGGKLYDKADAKISVYDHGLLYGDGVFEGIRSYAGHVFRLFPHGHRRLDGGYRVPEPRQSGAIVPGSGADVNDRTTLLQPEQPDQFPNDARVGCPVAGIASTYAFVGWTIHASRT